MEPMFLSIINSNSKWYEDHKNYKDALKERSWIEWFIKNWGFSDEILKDNYQFEQFSDLRSILNNAMDTIISGKELTGEQLEKITGYLALSKLNYCLKVDNEQYKLALIPVTADWNYVLSEIAASFIKAINEYDSSRFNRCENPDCKCVFHDSSKNQTRRWCCNSCSSLIKVRRYRQKLKM